MELNQLLSQIAEYTNDSIVITKGQVGSEGLEIVYVNRAFSVLSGYEPHEIVGKTPRVLYGPQTDSNTLERIYKAVSEYKSITAEIQHYSKSGRPYWIEISLNPVFDKDIACAYYVAIERDITERKTAELNLIRSRDDAEAATRAKSDFLANMSHELRTPMNGILGLADLMRGMELTAEQSDCINAIYNSGASLLNILNDILDLSKIEAREIDLDVRPFQFRRLLQKVRDLTSHLASKKGLKYDISLGLDVPEWLKADDNRLQQILFNLVSNAIKFTERGKVELDVDFQKYGGQYKTIIKVSDTGIGIPQDFHDRLYNKFTQADSSITRKFGGTGLGLAITRTLVELMGGTIDFESEEGLGTTFTVILPLEELSAKEAEKLASPISKHDAASLKSLAELTKRDLKDIRILVVEDHPVNTMLVEKWLQKLGLENIDCVANGFETLSDLRHNTYDAILMDCQMPELDGFETTSLIRDMEKNLMRRTPIIAMTANAMMGERERCLAAGMDDYMSKPLQYDRLKECLAYWLRSKTNAEENLQYIPARQELVFEDETEEPTDAPPVDMSRLQEFTEGDNALQEHLIKLFNDNSEPLIDVMGHQCHDGASEDWRRAAHTLKGAAGNLGAGRLHKLAMKAERMFDKNSAVKEHILHLIQEEYTVVNHYLSRTYH